MLSNAEIDKGVYFLSKKKDEFSSIYLDVRDKEKRLYTDEVTAQLPHVSKSHPYYQEWALRQKSTDRIINYLTRKDKPLNILDLGCGNGWFSNQIACISQTQIIAVDVNDDELKQAARVFQKPNLKFVYADIFSQESDDLQTFDIITVNSCIQYFDNLENILRQLKSKLSSVGELHIIDSPFYQQSDIASAKERTLAYYQSLGFPEMAEHYFHHTLTNVGAYEIMYKPNRSALNKLFRRIDTPFMWLKFDK